MVNRAYINTSVLICVGLHSSDMTCFKFSKYPYDLLEDQFTKEEYLSITLNEYEPNFMKKYAKPYRFFISSDEARKADLLAEKVISQIIN